MGDVIKRDFGGLAEVKSVSGKPPCRHTQTVVDERARTVECGTCGQALDPIRVLLEYAEKERHWRNWQSAVHEQQRALEELKEEERKAKARLKNAQRKDAEFAVSEERRRNQERNIDSIVLAQELEELAGRLKRKLRGGR